MICTICQSEGADDATGLCSACSPDSGGDSGVVAVPGHPATNEVRHPVLDTSDSDAVSTVSPLKILRLDHKMTQEQCAQLFKVSWRTWCRWEHTKVSRMGELLLKHHGWK